MERTEDKQISQRDHAISVPCQSSPGATLKAAEPKHPERSLSPVLNNSNQYRKMIIDRRRNRTSSRVKLTKRFEQGQGKIVPGDERTVTRIYDDLQALDCNNVEDRLKKIKEFECEKKKFTGCLYKKTASELLNSSGSTDFTFKKPLSPLSGMKKTKSNSLVLLHDRKSTNVDLDCVKKEVSSSANETIFKSENLPVESNHMGFCTGAGKAIIVPPDNLKIHSKIFNDILNTRESHINRKNFNLHANYLNRPVTSTQLPSESKEFQQTETFLGEFHGAADIHSSQIPEVSKLHPKDVLFVHPSISDTQMILAADIAMSMMDIPSDDWAPVPNILSDFESKISELNDIGVQDKSANDLAFNEHSHNTTVEYEMSELEKVLNEDSVGQILGDSVQLCKDHEKENLLNCDPSYLGVDDKKIECMEVHPEATVDCNKEIDASKEQFLTSSTESSSVQTVIENQINDGNTLSGFFIDEYNLALNIFRNHNKLIKMKENAYSGCTIADYEQLNVPISINCVLKTAAQEKNKFNVKSPYKFNYSEPRENNIKAGNLHQGLTTFIPGNEESTKDSCDEERVGEDTVLKDFETHRLPAQKVEAASVCPMGFSTAGGKIIKISDKAMRRATTIFSDEDISPNKLEHSAPIQDTLVNMAKSNNPFMGFSTAGGVGIKISEKAMKRARTIFNDEDLDENKSEVQKSAPFSASNGVEKSDGTILDFSNKPTEFNAQTPMGFSTAGGSSIKISERAMKRARTIFTDEDLDGNKLQVQKSAPFSASNGVEKSDGTIPGFSNKPTAFNAQTGVRDSSTPMGFFTAGGSSIKISEKAMKRARTIFTDEDLDGNKLQVQKSAPFSASNGVEKSDGTVPGFSNKPTEFNAQKGVRDSSTPMGFSTAGGSSIKISEKAMKRARTIFTDEDLSEQRLEAPKLARFDAPKRIETDQLDGSENIPSAGFFTASGKCIRVTEDAVKEAKRKFTDENLYLNNSEPGKRIKATCQLEYTINENVEFSTATGTNMSISETKNMPFSTSVDLSSATLGQQCSNGSFGNLQQNDDVKATNMQNQSKVGAGSLGGFSTATGKYIGLSETNLKRARVIFGDEDLTACLESSATSAEESESCSQNMQNKTHPSELKEADEKVGKSKLCPLNPRKLFSEFRPVTRTDTSIPSPSRARSAKKRLGVSFCKQIAISNDRLQKAKLIFQDFDQNISTGQKEPVIYSSTPVKEVAPVPAIPSRTDDVKANSLTSLTITPVKRLPCVEKCIIDGENDSNSPIIFQKQTEGGADAWIENINKEYEYLENRLKVILERRKALEEQKKRTENENGTDRRQILGVLLGKKQISKKLSLKQVAGDRRPGDDINAPRQILDVTPKNAVHVHFNCNWKKDTSEQRPVVKTADGAVLIPNAKDVIGLSEIQASFKAMPGVDPKLLPSGWIQNHFKWIVWKLASLERSFPSIFTECLSLENVIQQLKYRYDREIDRVERSALRRITEKDDVPQKRMILCVADITKISDMYDLELTDGWYSIRTVIDQQLCRQIVTGKIIVGTKLIIQCAEILNCVEGWHPLEIPDNVRLKINYNCTRRAMWHAKLGYQSIAGPFPILLKTIHPDGGTIGCIKVCIARVYPLKYMERQNGKIVWRNNKAEQKRAQEWEYERAKEMEIIKHKLETEYEKNLTLVQKNNALEKVDLSRISDITSPSLLYHLYTNANDQESFMNKLSTSQFASAMEYQTDIYNKRQEELSRRLSDEVKKLQSSREVSPVLKLQVIDANEESDRGFIFSIWKPSEDLLQTLKEGCLFSVFNIIPRLAGDLASTSRTHFKLETASSGNLRVQRYLLPISSVQRKSSRPLFNEYDTVGTAVTVYKNSHHQGMWLTDAAANLLHIKIVEGPERCSLLDSINRGQNVALMNLVFYEPRGGFAEANANQTTVITSFPQHKFLQTGLEAHSAQLPKNLTTFLDDCDKKIKACCMKLESMSSLSSSAFSSFVHSTAISTSDSSAFDDSSEDNTLVSSRMTTTDVAMSLIDTDKYFENV